MGSGESDPEPGSGPHVGTYDEIAHQLTDSYWDWISGGSRGRHAFDAAPGGTLTADVTALTPAAQQLARSALEAWTNVTGIEFRFVTGGADITFDHDVAPGVGGQGGATELGPGGEILRSGVHISRDLLADRGASIDSNSFHTLVHEIGHALGLGHSGDYPRDLQHREDIDFEVDAKFLNDSQQVSLMSYFWQPANTYIDASFARPVTPMIADIIAIQDLYGVPASIRPGDTVYGYASNVGGYLGRLFAAMSGEERDSDVYAGGPVALTIYDTGGNDTLDLRWDGDDQRVELRPEAISDVLGLTGNPVIARDTVIENFVAGSGNDAANRLEGRAGSDALSGRDGDDTLAGGAGADRLDGGPGRDTLWYGESDAGVRVDLGAGTARGGHADGDSFENVEGVIGSRHPDTLAGGDGDDTLSGGAGADRLTGRGGHDWLRYGESDAGVHVDLAAGTARAGHAEGDSFEGIEGIIGSGHADTLSGGDGSNGLEGGAGADRLDGGAGRDTLWYATSDAGVHVDLGAGTARGGHAEGDAFANVEGVIGSPHADTLAGGDGADELSGGPGGDWLVGSAGADRMDGGPGHDTLWYDTSDAGVRVDLDAGTGGGGHAQGDTFANVEGVIGSRHSDTLEGGAGNDRLSGGPGDDRLVGGSGDDWLWGNEGDDTLVGGAGNDGLDGGAGADSLDGGPGDADWLSYDGSDAGVHVDFGTGTARGGHAEGDTFANVEGVIGSRYGDTLSGGAGRDGLVGGAGDDVLAGGTGEDRLWGNEGDDTLVGGAGDDLLAGGAGADRMDGGPGDADRLSYGGSEAGVDVDLAAGTARGGHAEGDLFAHVESVAGSQHADTLTGDAGDNHLSGLDGHDTLTGGAGDDVLTGGNGRDRFHGGEGADNMDGGAGRDTLWYAWSDAGVDVDLAAGTARGGHAEGDTIENVEVVWGSRHADTLTGGEGRNWLDGGPDGDDLLTAGAGGDILTGGSGNDTLIGGAGNNTFRGDAGSDVFVFDGSRPNGKDVIYDFADGPSPGDEQDVIELHGDLSFSSLILTASGDDVVITTSDEAGNIHITLDNYLVGRELSDLTAEDFVF